MGLADRDYMRNRARSPSGRRLPIYRQEDPNPIWFNQSSVMTLLLFSVLTITGRVQKLMTFIATEALNISATTGSAVTSADRAAAYDTPVAIVHALYPVATCAIFLGGIMLITRRNNQHFCNLIKSPVLSALIGVAISATGFYLSAKFFSAWERENYPTLAPAAGANAFRGQNSVRTSGAVDMYLPMQGNISRMMFRNDSTYDLAVTLRYNLKEGGPKRQAAKLFVGARKAESIDIPSFVYEVSIERFAPDGAFTNPYVLNNVRSVTYRNPVDLNMPASRFSDFPLLSYDQRGDLTITAGRLSGI